MHIHTLRERHTHLRGRDTHSEKHTKTLPRRPTTLRQTHKETETHMERETQWETHK